MMRYFKSFLDVLKKYQVILNASQKKWGFIVAAMTIIGAILETLGVSIILPLVQIMLDPEGMMKNAFFRSIVDIFDIHTNMELVILITLFVVLVYLLKNGFLFLLSYIRIRYACKVQRELSVEMMESYMKRGYAFFTNTSTAELLRGMQGSIYNTYNGIYQLLRLLAEALTTVCICLFVLASDLIIAIVVLIVVVFCLLSVVVGFKKWAQKSGEIIYKYDAILNKTILQAFQGIKEVLVMKKQKFFVGTYKRDYIKRQRGCVWQTVAIESPVYFIETSCVIGILIAFAINFYFNQDGKMMIPQLATLAMAIVRIMPSLGRITCYINTFITCVPGIEDTYTNIKQARMSFDNEGHEISANEPFKIINWNVIKFKNISWSYPDSSQKILDNISLTIERGKSIALVGASGTGKTTLADIILGLYVPKIGSVCIDKEDISFSTYDISNVIGFVPQNTYLLDDTIRKNIAFGLSEDQIDDYKVWKVIEQAQLKDFVLNMPNKLETVIGESGVRLSGGQRQRIAVARALYNEPSIIVLDEATSALDNDTEAALMEEIEELHGSITLIIVAHRLTTIRNCDEIYRIQDGKLHRVNYEELIQI